MFHCSCLGLYKNYFNMKTVFTILYKPPPPPLSLSLSLYYAPL